MADRGVCSGPSAGTKWVFAALSLLILCWSAGCGSSKATSSNTSTAGSNEAMPESDELIELNNQGVGYMEQFDEGGGFPKAVQVYKDIVRRWPNWISGKFNLAVAILNNKPSPENLSIARKLLEEILAKDDRHARAHYTLGFLLQYDGKYSDALPHFERVCFELVPTDAMSWMRLGDCLDSLPAKERSKVTKDDLTPETCYARALELNPNLPSAYYKMSMSMVRGSKLEEAARLRERFTALSQVPHDPYANDYIWSGPLAEAIGAKLPPSRPNASAQPVYTSVAAEFPLAENAVWATDDDLKATAHGGVLARIRNRFGPAIVVADFDGDGDLDLLLPAAAVESGKLRDVLFRNDGNGRFVDVTASAGLADSRASIGCAVADFDADGLPDIYITAVGGNHLFRNLGRGKFEEVTEAAGVAETGWLSMSALFLDIDHDGDIDLLVANYGPIDQADQMFLDSPYQGGAPNSLYLNIGAARTTDKATPDRPPLETRFEKQSGLSGTPWGRASATVGFVAGDFDNDRDLDLIEINDSSPCRMLINRRLGQWSAEDLPETVVPTGRYNGGVAADFNSDLTIDLMLIGIDGSTVYAHNHVQRGQADRLPEFKPVTTDLRGLRSAQVVDIDCDGWWDVVGIGIEPPAVVLGSNTARGMLARPEWVRGLFDDKSPPRAVLCASLTGDDWPQLVVLHESGAPTLWRTAGNGSQWIGLSLSGHRKVAEFSTKQPRSNTEGIGTRVIVHSGPNAVVCENTNRVAGLSQSQLPIHIGLSNRAKADVVRLRWPDGIEQAELNLPAGKTISIDETARRGDSCPLLFVWNGESFGFVTDFLGGGGIGYMVEPGEYAAPDPDEDVSIDPSQIVPDKTGHYVVKIAEPMDEMTYLDAAWLEVIDHPIGTTVYASERFNPDAAHPSGGRAIFHDRIELAGARDHRGCDVRDQLAGWDRKTVDNFARSAQWIGYAEDHFVELDFGQSFAGLDEQMPIALFLAGWVEYPYSQTNWAAATAGTKLKPPVLKWLNERGEWDTLVESMGYPAGLPRMMVLDLTGKLPAAVRGDNGRSPVTCRLRIETNMEIYWDQIFAARLDDVRTVRRTVLNPSHADLSYRGYLQEFSPDGHEPKLFDYHQIISVPLVGLDGIRTPYGSVRDLLLEQDDRFVLINAGDEVTLRFDSRELPDLPSGWTRSFVLRSFGYCKDTDLFNQFDRTVEPLPGPSLSPSLPAPVRASD